MDVSRDRGSSMTAAAAVLVLPVVLRVCDRPVDNVLVCGGIAVRGGTTIFGDRTPSALCHAIVNGFPLYSEPSDTASMTTTTTTRCEHSHNYLHQLA